jgi:predicted component of viral defense system (DUF524 family)
METAMATLKTVPTSDYNKQVKLVAALEKKLIAGEAILAKEVADHALLKAKLKAERKKHRAKTLAAKTAHLLSTTEQLSAAKTISDAKIAELRDLLDRSKREEERLRLLLAKDKRIKGNLELVNQVARSKNQHVISGGKAGSI